ncbi:response regulator [Lysinibacillus sp. FSL K6-4013]|uniref:response regulator n=1 Tax=Lysinibacillus sp. FSL K6-4013 TaxID=2921504 RepID=UPI00315ABF8B
MIDIMLGEEMSGWDLVRELRKREQTKELPIIISSALDEVKEMVDQFQIKKYLTKPYPPEEISKLFVK